MGLNKQQQVNDICNRVAWLSLRDRLRVFWALLTKHAS